MRKYENVDIMALLGAAVEFNTHAYKEDLRFDAEVIKKAILNMDGESNRFLWLSRRNGTVCLKEKDVYINDTGANTAWLFYAKHKGEGETFLAFAIEVTGVKNDRLIGNVYEVDYLKHVAEVKQYTFESLGIDIIFEDGTRELMTETDFNKLWEYYNTRHGKAESITHLSDNEDKLAALLKVKREEREKQRPVAINHQAALGATAVQNTQVPKKSIREQLAEEKQWVASVRAITQVIADSRSVGASQPKREMAEVL